MATRKQSLKSPLMLTLFNFSFSIKLYNVLDFIKKALFNNGGVFAFINFCIPNKITVINGAFQYFFGQTFSKTNLIFINYQIFLLCLFC